MPQPPPWASQVPVSCAVAADSTWGGCWVSSSPPCVSSQLPDTEEAGAVEVGVGVEGSPQHPDAAPQDSNPKTQQCGLRPQWLDINPQHTADKAAEAESWGATAISHGRAAVPLLLRPPHRPAPADAARGGEGREPRLASGRDMAYTRIQRDGTQRDGTQREGAFREQPRGSTQPSASPSVRTTP